MTELSLAERLSLAEQTIADLIMENAQLKRDLDRCQRRLNRMVSSAKLEDVTWRPTE
jgi:phage shock protein A